MKYEYACKYEDNNEYEGDYEYACEYAEEYGIEVECCQLHEVELETYEFCHNVL